MEPEVPPCRAGDGAALLVLGATQLRELPVDVLPEFSPPTVEIQTEALGLSATEVEQLITVPMEQDLLNGVAWLDTIRSESIPGLSRVELIFEPGTDLLRARQVVQERLTQAHAWTIRPRLMGVPGVANVAIWGQRERQLQVQADPERMRRHGVTLNQVVETTGNALWVSPLTFLEASTPAPAGSSTPPTSGSGSATSCP